MFTGVACWGFQTAAEPGALVARNSPAARTQARNTVAVLLRLRGVPRTRRAVFTKRCEDIDPIVNVNPRLVV